MDKKLMLVLTVLLVLSLVANVILLVVLRNSRVRTGEDITGLLTGAEQKSALLGDDVIEISRDELTMCCSFININGEEDGCYVLKGYDCGFCSDYCG